jgi:hypothetical protein
LAAAVTPGQVYEQQREDVAATRLALAVALSQTREYAEAGGALDALDDAPGRWVKRPEAAALASRLVRVTAEDPRLAADERRRFGRAFTDRALALLRRAAAEGVAAPPGQLDSDDFRPLRGLPEFQRLRDQLSRKATPDK